MGTNFRNPRKFPRSDSIKVYSKVSINCYASRKSAFKWIIFKVNSTGHTNEPISNLPQDSITNRSILELPPRALPYGTYKFQLNVSVVNLTLVDDSQVGYGMVTVSPLQCFVQGGSGWYQSVSRDIVLDGHHSNDPDETQENSTNGIEYYWYCKKNDANYTFPDRPESQWINYTSAKEGCLSVPAGPVAKGQSIKTYSNGSFSVNDSLHFRFYCVKGSRMETFDVSLTIRDIDPLQCFISTEGLTLNRRIITSSKLTLRAKCHLWNRRSSALKIKWFLQEKNHSVWETKELSKVAQSQIDKIDLVLRKDALQSCSWYRAIIQTNIIGGSTTGNTYIDFETHCSPRGGSCRVLPREGLSSTNFRFECEKWMDYNNETNNLHFEYYYKAKPYHLPLLFIHTEKTRTGNLTLPEGDVAFGYRIEIKVLISDIVGSTTTVFLQVKVKPDEQVSTESPCAMLNKEIQKNGELVNLEMEDNSQALNHWSLVNVNKLNKESQQRAKKKQNLTTTLTSIERTLSELPNDNPTETESAKLKAEIEEMKFKIEALDIQSKNCCYIRERIAISLTNIQLDSIGTIAMTSSTIFALAGSPEDQCLQCLIRLVETLQRVFEFFREYTPVLNFNDVTRGMASFFQASAGVLHGFSYVLEQVSQGNATMDEENKQLANFYTDALLNLVKNTTDILKCCVVPNEFPTLVLSPELNVSMSKNTYDMVNGLNLGYGSGDLKLPEDLSFMDSIGANVNDTTSTVTSEALSFLNNPFTEDNTSSLVKSVVVDVTMYNDNGSIRLQNLTNPIELKIKKQGSLVNCVQGTIKYGETRYHKFSVLKNESSINVNLRWTSGKSVKPEFGVALRKGARPKQGNKDTWKTVPSFDEENHLIYTVFYSDEESNSTMAGDYFVAVKYNRTLEDQEISADNGNAKLNYTLCAYTSDCIYWNTLLKKWTNDGCKVGARSNMTHTQCLCNHATSFASDFVVPPNSIDWDAISLDALLDNFLVAGVLLTFVGLYFLLLIPARRQDLKDLEKIGVIPIPSNDPRDMYGYEVCLYTGFQAGNGSTAQVSIILSGSKDNTQPRILCDIDKKRKLFQRGEVDSFLVTTPHDLGQLGSIKIWHNHGGNNPSWFLSRLYVRDLQNDTKTWYICNRWLAVEEDDGKIERVLHTATNKELTSFNILFAMEARKNFSDSHLWFSVYYRPPQSTFTRVQRLTCCICVLLSTMLANAMFYQTGGSKRNAEVILGPFRLSTQQISIAITSSLVVLPMNLLIMNLFRKARTKNPSDEDKIKRLFNDEHQPETEQVIDEDEEHDDPVYEVISIDNHSEVSKQSDQTAGENDEMSKKEIGPKQPFSLPYWSVYIAYVLAFLTCATSTTFTIFYSLTFGKEKSEGWISAMMISFWQDVLVSQPIKVLALAVIIAIITKDPNKIDNDTQRSAELGHDEEWIHREPDSNERLRLDNFIPKPPCEDVLYESRQMLIKQKEMKAIIREIIVYFVYLMVLCTIAYASQDPQAFQVSQATQNMFFESSYAGMEPLDAVAEPVNFWKWLHSTVIPTLKPSYWYGPHSDTQEQQIWTEQSIKRKSRRGWKVKIHKRILDTVKVESKSDNSSKLHKFPKNSIADRGTAYIIGSARLRQLRVLPGHCSVHPFFKGRVFSCSATYSWENEDEGSYLSGWTPVNETSKEALQKDKTSSWIWRSAWELKGSPYWGRFTTYWGGGYVANVNPSRLHTIEDMQSLELDMWIDRYTRAIFTEFALYNAYTNVFCVVTMLSEIIPTGGYSHYPQFRPIRLYRYTGPEQMVLMAFEIVYMIFLFMFTYSEFKELYRRKKKYFEDPWNYLEILVIVLSFSAIGLYFARLGFGKLAVQRMKESPSEFVSFTYVLLLDEWQVATLGLAVFFAILKSVRLLRFNRRMSILTMTVKACAGPLMSFFIMFFVVFLAYVQFAFIVFGPVEESYSSFSTCLVTMLSMTLGGFDFASLMSSNRILGSLFFLSYMIFVFMIMINVFLAIINDTIAEVKSDVELQSNDYEIMDFVMHQIKAVAGVPTGPAVKPVYKKYKTQFQNDVDAIESLSENIEYALVNTIVEDQRQTNWLMVENITKKKLILVNALLRIPEEYDEDDLSNLIPLIEKFLIKHSNEEVARMVLRHRFEHSVLMSRESDANQSDEITSNESLRSDSIHLYETPLKSETLEDYVILPNTPTLSSTTRQSKVSVDCSDNDSNSSKYPLGKTLETETLSDDDALDEEVSLHDILVDIVRASEHELTSGTRKFSEEVDHEFLDKEAPSDSGILDVETDENQEELTKALCGSRLENDTQDTNKELTDEQTIDSELVNIVQETMPKIEDPKDGQTLSDNQNISQNTLPTNEQVTDENKSKIVEDQEELTKAPCDHQLDNDMDTTFTNDELTDEQTPDSKLVSAAQGTMPTNE